MTGWKLAALFLAGARGRMAGALLGFGLLFVAASVKIATKQAV
ncbi:hypothetical protein [Planktotalea arctica]